MTVGHIFTKIGNFIENRYIFMLLNCNCAKLADFEDFKTCLGAVFSWTQCTLHRPHNITIVVGFTSTLYSVIGFLFNGAQSLSYSKSRL